MKGNRLNDEERRLWVLNEESLYNMQRTSRRPMRAFIRENRETIDATIRAALAPKPKTWRDYAGC